MDHLTFLEHKGPKNDLLSLLPFTCDLGSHSECMSDGPDYLLKRGLEPALSAAGFAVRVLPEIRALRTPGMPKEDLLPAIALAAAAARDAIKSERSKGRRTLALGGDHAIAIGTIAGASAACSGDLGVIWIDAHADINTPETSPSGNVHGMPVAVLLGRGDKQLTDVVVKPIKKEHLLYIGLKDLDQSEIDFLRNENIAAVTLFDIMQHGFGTVTRAIDDLAGRVSELWVSLDLDAIDESVAPASAMATAGSMNYREISGVFTYLGTMENVVGMDIAELTPAKDVGGKTAELCFELSAAAFGGRYGWYERYLLKEQGHDVKHI